MAVYKRTRRDRSGDLIEASGYTIRFKDHRNILRRLPALKDKRGSYEMERHLGELVGTLVNGYQITPELVTWLEGLPDPTQARLAEWGMTNPRVCSLTNPLTVHINACCTDHDTQVTSDFGQLTRTRLLNIVEGCGWTYWRDINAAEFRSWLMTRDMKGNTRNHYMQALHLFCNWMVEIGAAASSPLKTCKRLPRVTDEVKFGSFTTEQFDILTAYCEQAEDIWGINQRRRRPPGNNLPKKFVTGPDRVFIYRLAVECGQRADTLRSLTVGQMKFDGTGGIIRTTGGQQKNRWQHDVPIRPEFAVEIQQVIRGKAPGARVITLPTYAAAMLRNDLLNAGLPLVDEDGLPLMFHSFRVTCGTWLGENGATSQEIAAVLGHRTRAMVDHYTHATRAAGRRAIQKMPALRATGTDGILAHNYAEAVGQILAIAGTLQPTPLDFNGPSRNDKPGWGGRVVEGAGLENR